MPDSVHVREVAYTKGAIADEFEVRQGNLRVKLMRFEKGDQIPMHRHSDPKHEKLIVEGSFKFTDDDGTSVVLGAGTLYMCGSGALYYSGAALEPAVIMVIESADSKLERPSE